MKRNKFSPLPENTEVAQPTIVHISGEMPVVWRNRRGYIVVERCYSLTTQQWITAHRPNAVVLPTPAGGM